MLQTSDCYSLAWKNIFDAAWKTFRTEFEHLLKNLRRHKGLVENQASLIEYEQSQAARLLAQSAFDEFEKAETDRRRVALEGKLQPANSIIDQEMAADTRREYPNTGRWILERPLMKDWIKPENESTSILWLSGIPGAGELDQSAWISFTADIASLQVRQS